MKVILLKSIPKLGNAGDIVDVSVAYARNVLIKNKQAKPATKENVATHAKTLAKQKKRENLDAKEAKETYKKLNSAQITFLEKASTTGTLFAGIDEKKIAKKLSDTHNVTINPHNILLDEHLKTVGAHSVPFKLGESLSGSCNVIIKRKK